MHFINYDLNHPLNDFKFRESNKGSCNFKCFVKKQKFGTRKINDLSILKIISCASCKTQYGSICLVDFSLSKHLFVFSFLLASEEVCPSITTFMFGRTCLLSTRRFQSPSKSHRFVSQLSAVVIFCFEHVIPDRVFRHRLIKKLGNHSPYERWIPGFNK